MEGMSDSSWKRTFVGSQGRGWRVEKVERFKGVRLMTEFSTHLSFFFAVIPARPVHQVEFSLPA